MSDPSRPRVRVILNPNAASGTALRRVGEIGEALRRYDFPHEIVLTRARGHAKELARAAAADGVDVIAVVGGDGTLNEVSQAYLGDDGEAIPGPDLALIPNGTGGDFKKTLGMSGALDEAVAQDPARSPPPDRSRRAAWMLVATNGEERLRMLVNIASFRDRRGQVVMRS